FAALAAVVPAGQRELELAGLLGDAAAGGDRGGLQGAGGQAERHHGGGQCRQGVSHHLSSSRLSSHFSCLCRPTRLATVAAMFDSPAVSDCFRPSLPPLTLSYRISGTGLSVCAVLAL